MEQYVARLMLIRGVYISYYNSPGINTRMGAAQCVVFNYPAPYMSLDSLQSLCVHAHSLCQVSPVRNHLLQLDQNLVQTYNLICRITHDTSTCTILLVSDASMHSYQQVCGVLQEGFLQQHHVGEWHTPHSLTGWVGDEVWRTRVDPPLHMLFPVHVHVSLCIEPCKFVLDERDTLM